MVILAFRGVSEALGGSGKKFLMIPYVAAAGRLLLTATDVSEVLK